jgi:hypothetical protein
MLEAGSSPSAHEASQAGFGTLFHEVVRWGEATLTGTGRRDRGGRCAHIGVFKACASYSAEVVLGWGSTRVASSSAGAVSKEGRG